MHATLRDILMNHANAYTTEHTLDDGINQTSHDYYLNDTTTTTTANNHHDRTRRGASLLRSLNPRRTCRDAGIPEEFCVCQQETRVDQNSATVNRTVQSGANVIVRRINQIITVIYIVFILLYPHLYGFRGSATNNNCSPLHKLLGLHHLRPL